MGEKVFKELDVPYLVFTPQTDSFSISLMAEEYVLCAKTCPKYETCQSRKDLEEISNIPS